MESPAPLPEFAPLAQTSDPQVFAAAVAAAAQAPLVLRSAVDHWPLVTASLDGISGAAAYLQPRYSGEPVYTIVGAPEIRGQFRFREDFSGLNYQARQTSLLEVLQHLAQQADPDGFAIAVQSAPLRQIVQDWDAEHRMPFAPAGIAPTLWLNNRARVAPHSDIHDNVACVVAGARRFTLFPPEQIDNLYIAPLRGAPGGVPISAANLWEPDLERHPRFAEALAAATAATLNPGDAIFIPALWWHAVESLASFNLLVNYWWGGVGTAGLSPAHALSHAVLAISALPAALRARWASYFAHLVFRASGEPGAHLPEHTADLLTVPSRDQVRDTLREISAALERAGDGLDDG